MTIQQIYTKYSIPINLQQHMLRVASLAKIITDNWQGPQIDSDLIIQTCLLHDMGNILKFDFSRADILDPADRNRAEQLKQSQSEFRQKYGDDCDQATLQIIDEITPNSHIKNLVEQSHWHHASGFTSDGDWDKKIACYSDMRIGPFGILPLANRFADLKKRRPKETQDLIKLEQTGIMLEHQIQEHANLNLNSINNSDLESNFVDLNNTPIN